MRVRARAGGMSDDRTEILGVMLEGSRGIGSLAWRVRTWILCICTWGTLWPFLGFAFGKLVRAEKVGKGRCVGLEILGWDHQDRVYVRFLGQAFL